MLSIEKVGGYKTAVQERTDIRERRALRNKVKGEEHSRDLRGVKRRNRNETHLHGPMDCSKTMKLRFRVGDLDLPERRKRCASSREEEEISQMCPCGKAVESRTRIVGEFEIYKEERDVLEKMRKIDEGGMEKFRALDSSEKTIAVLGDRWWPQKAKQEGGM